MKRISLVFMCFVLGNETFAEELTQKIYKAFHFPSMSNEEIFVHHQKMADEGYIFLHAAPLKLDTAKENERVFLYKKLDFSPRSLRMAKGAPPKSRLFFNTDIAFEFLYYMHQNHGKQAFEDYFADLAFPTLFIGFLEMSDYYIAFEAISPSLMQELMKQLAQRIFRSTGAQILKDYEIGTQVYLYNAQTTIQEIEHTFNLLHEEGKEPLSFAIWDMIEVSFAQKS
ncbi:MAG: hypothetical protein ACRCS8_03355 [Brevinema sp.]